MFVPQLDIVLDKICMKFIFSKRGLYMNDSYVVFTLKEELFVLFREITTVFITNWFFQYFFDAQRLIRDKLHKAFNLQLAQERK